MQKNVSKYFIISLFAMQNAIITVKRISINQLPTATRKVVVDAMKFSIIRFHELPECNGNGIRTTGKSNEAHRKIQIKIICAQKLRLEILFRFLLESHFARNTLIVSVSNAKCAIHSLTIILSFSRWIFMVTALVASYLQALNQRMQEKEKIISFQQHRLQSHGINDANEMCKSNAEQKKIADVKLSDSPTDDRFDKHYHFSTSSPNISLCNVENIIIEIVITTIIVANVQ